MFKMPRVNVVMKGSIALVAVAFGTLQASCLPASAPFKYTGIPGGDYSPEWQHYFRVKDDLPGIDFDLGQNYAGNIDVQRDKHPNDTLFFWGFEKDNGSLTAEAEERSMEPWAVWLQGGPGTSSLYGLFTENGPISLVPGTKTLTRNEYGWSNLIDYFWVDQPVGVGFATSDRTGYAHDEEQVGADFVGFLENLVKVFPGLATRPFYLTGESYAGRYIPYIAKAIFSSHNPPVNLAKIVVGDPAFGSDAEFKTMPTLNLLQTYPQIIGYDVDVYDYFKKKSHLCGLDLNLTYPQAGGKFPSIKLSSAKNKTSSNRGFFAEVRAKYQGRFTSDCFAHDGRRTLQRCDLSDPNPFGDTKYGCSIWDEMVDYAVNFTYPWSVHHKFDSFDVPDALHPPVSLNLTFFLNNDAVQKAIHAPSKNWTQTIHYPWGSKKDGHDHSPEPMTFFDEFAANMSNNAVSIVIYVGNDDAISNHFGTEVTIQNTTFGGIQGFIRKPGTPWWDEDGNWAGIVHQERNWTYALIYGAGHEVAAGRPISAYTFVREFVLGHNQTGLVQNVNGSVVVVGGENPTLQQPAIPGQRGIAYGSRTTEGLTTWPSATIAAFENHVGFVSITGTIAVQPTATPPDPDESFVSRKTLLSMVCSWLSAMFFI